MPSRSTPLSNYPVLRSRDPDFARDRLATVFGATRFDIPAGAKTFEVHANHAQIGGLGLSYCDYACDASLEFGEASFVRQLFNISGSGRYEAGDASGEIAPGSWSSILPAHAPLKLDLKAGYRQFVVRIEIGTLSRYLGALLGQEIHGTLGFQGTSYPPAMTSLRRWVC